MRYVIKNAEGKYFSQFDSVETRKVTLKGVHIGDETTMSPTFKGDVSLGSRFDTAADAEEQIRNDLQAYPLHGGPDAFAGCSVEEING